VDEQPAVVGGSHEKRKKEKRDQTGQAKTEGRSGRPAAMTAASFLLPIAMCAPTSRSDAWCAWEHVARRAGMPLSVSDAEEHPAAVL
jgi:hypothetical protein